MTGNAAGMLSPGISQTLALTLTNPNNVAIEVTALTAVAASGSSKAGCDGPTNLLLTQSNVSASNTLAIPANGHVFVARRRRQRTCRADARPADQPGRVQERVVHAFTYSGSAHA